MKTIRHLKRRCTLLLLFLIAGGSHTLSAQTAWEQMSSMDIARGYMASCRIDSLIYVFGGETTPVHTSLDSADVFNIRTNSWLNLEPVPVVSSMAAAEAINNKIYLLGGWPLTNAVGTALNSVNEYDPVSDSWQSKTNSPESVGGWASVTLGDSIYLLGGSPGNNTETSNRARTYKPESERWTSLPDMPKYHPSGDPVEIINNKLYYVGGNKSETGWGNPEGNVECYDLLSGTWSVRSPMPVAVALHIITQYNGKILVFGGSKELTNGCSWGCSTGSDYIQAYDPETDSWSFMKPMPFTRAGMTAEKVDNQLYLIGGYKEGRDLDQPLNEVWRFNLDSLQEWCEEVNIIMPSDTFEVGDKFLKLASILPLEFAYKDLIWSSDNESVAKFDGGYIECVGLGTATITAQLKYGGCSDTYALEVLDRTPPVVNVEKDTVEFSSETMVRVSSSENGFVYLVPENTAKDLSDIRDNMVQDSLAIEADNLTDLSLDNLDPGTYWLYARDGYFNISEPGKLVLISIEGINLQNAQGVRIYPNPANDNLFIETDNPAQFNINITSLNGQLILSREMEGSSAQIDFSSFQKGVYFITIRSRDLVSTRKIVKL